jgi:hypothetical protein
MFNRWSLARCAKRDIQGLQVLIGWMRANCIRCKATIVQQRFKIMLM